MALALNGHRITAIALNGKRIESAYINGRKVWPDNDEWFEVQYKPITQITLYIRQMPGEALEVNWGDGNLEKVNSLTDSYNSSVTHQYDTAKTRVVKFKGNIIGVHFSNYIADTIMDEESHETLAKKVPELEYVLNIPGWFKPTEASYTFAGCSSLKTVPWFDITNSRYTMQMFAGCSSLVEIPALDFSKTEAASGAFAYCRLLKHLPDLDFRRCTDIGGAFQGCTLLERVKMLTATDTLCYLSSLNSTFANCENLEWVDAKMNCTAAIPIGAKVSAYNMFRNCYKLQNIPFGNVQGIVDFEGCFKNCKSLVNIELTLRNGRYFKSMFEGCSNLIKVNLTLNYERDSATQIYFPKHVIDSMFKDCILLTFLTTTTYDWGSSGYTKIDSIYPNSYDSRYKDTYPFEGCQALRREEIPSGLRWIYDDYHKEEV